jgi:hypothetical protein
MLAAIPTRGAVTIYSRIGDSFAYLNVAALILLAGWALVRKPPVAAPLPGGFGRRTRESAPIQ